MDDVLTLLGAGYIKDKYGVPRREAPTRTQVFCTVESVTRNEFFAGGRSGLNPEYKFIIFAGDYSGEDEIEYNGKGYAIYRTYHQPGTDYLELYVERKGGTNGQKSAS